MVHSLSLKFNSFIKNFSLVTLIFTAFVFNGLQTKASVNKAFDKKATVFVVSAQKENFSDKVQYPARIRSQINAWVVSESSGQVQNILKPVGSKVRKGETVLIVKNIDPVFRYAPVKMTAPADGFVTGLEVSLFSRVERGDKLFSITDPSKLIIETEIPSADLHFFQIGDSGKMKNENGEELKIKIQSLSPIVDIKTGTASATLSIITLSKDSKELKTLKQGQMGQVSFNVNQRKSIVIPQSSLVMKSGGTFVRVINNNKAKLIPIKISQDFGDKVEIESGLKDGEQVITRWNRFIADDEEVEIQKPEQEKM